MAGEPGPVPAPDLLAIGPAALSLAGLAPGWRDSVDQALGPLPAATGGEVASIPVAEAPWDPDRRGPLVALGTEVTLRQHGEQLDLEDGRSGVRARLADGRILLASVDGVAGASGRVLPFALAPPMLAAGAALLHAATVARGGRALLVLGPTGAGKSTTVVAARAAGLTVLGDDLAAAWDDQGWRVQGLARAVRIPPELAPGAPAIEGDERHRVSPEGWAVGGRAGLAGIVVLRHGQEGGIAPADRVEAAHELVAAAFATGLPSSVGPTLRIAAGLARLPAWHLALAADPARRVADAARDLAALLGRGGPRRPW